MTEEKNGFRMRDGAAIFLLAVFALIALQLVFGAISMPYYIAGKSYAEQGETYKNITLVASAFLQAGNLAVFALYLRRRKIRPAYFIKTKIKPWVYLLGVAFSVLCFAFFYPAAYSFDAFLSYIGFVSESVFEGGTLFQNIFIVAITVCLAPVCEELVFRSGLLSGLKLRFGDIRAAALCGLAFALMHMNPAQTVFQFFLGFSAAMLTLSCGSVLPAIIMHAFNNLYAILCDFVSPLKAPFSLMEDVFLSSTAGLVVSAFAFAAAGTTLIIFISKRLKAYNNKDNDKDKDKDESGQDGERVKDGGGLFIMLAAMAACLFMWIFALVSNIPK